MEDINAHIESHLYIKISFDKLLQHYEKLATSENGFLASKAKHILKTQQPFPVLRDGFSDRGLLLKYQKEIHTILQDSFSEVLTKNEIKAASIPFQDLTFNVSERFKSILHNAGKDFVPKMAGTPEDDIYRMACTIILKVVYGYKTDFKRPFYYEIPDQNGIVRTYKILYNADFVEIIPTEKAPIISKADYHELLENFDNLNLWKEKFPPQSYIFKGFVISNMFDVTEDAAISNIKSTLLIAGKRKSDNFILDFQSTFESLLNLKDIKVGFVIYNEAEQIFERVSGKGIESYLLLDTNVEACRTALCEDSFNTLVNERSYYTISDVEAYYKASHAEPQYKTLHEQGIKSAIFAPIANDGKLLGILEFVSDKPHVLNSVNANKLEDVMPYIVSSVLRSKAEEENLIEAVIQQECTSIHPSVYWKFEKAARKFLKDKQKGHQATFSKVSFENVYPLFGQIDVKESSDARNLATQKDLALQLSLIKKIIVHLWELEHLAIYEKLKFQLDNLTMELESNFKVDTEQQVMNFVKTDIEPLFEYQLKRQSVTSHFIEDYVSKVDPKLNIIYYYRKNYDDTIALINKKMAIVIDTKQIEAQQMYPHYFERYKTDGVEHNMYIGEAITNEGNFNEIYLYNLRLWQLQVMCEMENEFYHSQSQFPISLNVASMVLVFNQPLTIRFRMDEKQFDVDGTYNARYEVVKKRVDKAFIKGTEERITTKGKMTIIYSQKKDEEEYLSYIKFLNSKSILNDDVEILELEDLQGVTGLKAIRVSILYHKEKNEHDFYTYDDLIREVRK